MITENEFEKAEAIAEKELRAVIGPIRWANIKTTDAFFPVLQDAIANLIDKDKELEAAAAGKGITSVSNDGYSESYAINTAAALTAERQSAIKEWLSGSGYIGAY